MNNPKSGAADRVESGARMQAEGGASAALSSIYEFVCRDAQGREKWRERVANLVTTQGLNHLLDVTFKGATQITAWYVGLKGTGSPAAGDTHASHSGWTEVTGCRRPSGGRRRDDPSGRCHGNRHFRVRLPRSGHQAPAAGSVLRLRGQRHHAGRYGTDRTQAGTYRLGEAMIAERLALWAARTASGCLLAFFAAGGFVLYAVLLTLEGADWCLKRGKR